MSGGAPAEIEVEVFVPDPARPRAMIRVSFSDGMISLDEPADDDPDRVEKMMDLGAVLGWLFFYKDRKHPIAVLALRNAMEAYRDKWDIPKIMLPKQEPPPPAGPASGIVGPDGRPVN